MVYNSKKYFKIVKCKHYPLNLLTKLTDYNHYHLFFKFIKQYNDTI
jgi:hypothetical protein